MKKVRDRKILGMERAILAVLFVEVVLCILYIFEVVQNHWFRDVILGLGVLIHFMLLIFELMKKSKTKAAAAGLAIVLYAAILIWIQI